MRRLRPRLRQTPRWAEGNKGRENRHAPLYIAEHYDPQRHMLPMRYLAKVR